MAPAQHQISCTKCDYRVQTDDFKAIEIPPKCPKCAALIRPDVILFGELLNGKAIAVMQEEVAKGFDVVFSIGTSSVFPYIQAPLELARGRGNPTIEINPSETSVTRLVD